MKKKITKVHFFSLLTLFLALSLCGCSNQESQETPTVDPIEITISIDFSVSLVQISFSTGLSEQLIKTMLINLVNALIQIYQCS